MNTEFLIQLQYYTVLTDHTWTPICLWKMLYQGPEDSSTSGKMVLQWWQFNFLAMLLDHTINTRFLSPGQWHTVLTGSTRIPVYSRNMLYRGPQDSSKPGKPVLA